jgi:hypothetical protein
VELVDDGLVRATEPWPLLAAKLGAVGFDQALLVVADRGASPELAKQLEHAVRLGAAAQQISGKHHAIAFDERGAVAQVLELVSAAMDIANEECSGHFGGLKLAFSAFWAV